MFDVDIAVLIIKITVLLFSITIHEYAHGKMAFNCGDPTAYSLGRLTLNPLPHIDPFGAICLFLFNFGWAKPVPINTRYFKNIRTDIIKTSLAGPISNLILALIAGIIIRFISIHTESIVIFLKTEPMGIFLRYMLLMNIGLGLFNLLPIPPLDGSHVLANILPFKLSLGYYKFKQYGPIILIGIILLDNIAHTGIIRAILLQPMRFLASLFSGLNF